LLGWQAARRLLQFPARAGTPKLAPGLRAAAPRGRRSAAFGARGSAGGGPDDAVKCQAAVAEKKQRARPRQMLRVDGHDNRSGRARGRGHDAALTLAGAETKKRPERVCAAQRTAPHPQPLRRCRRTPSSSLKARFCSRRRAHRSPLLRGTSAVGGGVRPGSVRARTRWPTKTPAGGAKKPHRRFFHRLAQLRPRFRVDRSSLRRRQRRARTTLVGAAGRRKSWRCSTATRRGAHADRQLAAKTRRRVGKNASAVVAQGGSAPVRAQALGTARP